MKKRILTLSMCMVLGATSALATNIGIPMGNITPTVKAQPNAMMPFGQGVRPQMPNAQQQLEIRKHIADRKAQERELMYTTLGLTTEQKNKAENIDAKTRAEAGKYLRRIQVEARKLKELQLKKASWLEIQKQKHALNAAKKDADKFFENSKKSFKSILTKEQAKKFDVIDKAKKKEMKEFKKHHKYSGQPYYGPKPPPVQGFDKKGAHPESHDLKGLYGPPPAAPSQEDKK